MDGAFDTYFHAPSTSTTHIEAISHALSATLDPRIPNDIRKQALEHLENAKSQPDAPHHGFTLADDWKQSDAVRYYGLQMLEYAVRYRWAEYSGEQTEQLRQWVKQLAGSVREADKLYLRNKIAQVWAEVAKRSWAEEWMDMDRLLVVMWEKPISEKGTANKLLVLYILETLSEDVMNNEDAVAGLRLDVLGNALNEIMVPEGLWREFNSAMQRGERQLDVRSGEEGWLRRMCEFFAACVKQVRAGGEREVVKGMAFCAVKALHALRPTMAWINLKAAVEVNCVECYFMPFHTEDVALQTAATEVLYTLLNRPYAQHWHETWLELMRTALAHSALIGQAFERTQITPGEDDEKYTLLKKLAEVLSVLAEAVAQHPHLASSEELDMPAFFELSLSVLQNKSLVVSIPVLHSFTKLMAVQDSTVNDLVFQALGPLVQTCSARLLRYEALPDDTGDEITAFLAEDFDTQPERHAFLGNYRRYCVNIIQTIAHTRPTEALSHVLEQMREMLETGPYTGGRGFDSVSYSKTSLPALQFDAQYQVVFSALKGYAHWLADMDAVPAGDEVHVRAERDKASTTNLLQQWSYSVINMHSDDPEVAAQVLQILVAILGTAKPEPSFVLQVVQHLLTMRLYDNPAHTAFSDAVRSFEGLRVVELQKLAIQFSNELLEVYHELEPRIGVLVEKHADDPRLVWGFKAFLFMIVHRASGIDPDVRMDRLSKMLGPVYDAWQNPQLTASLASMQTFCEGLGMGELAEFYKAYGFDRSADWAAQQLDEAGQARQADIKAKNDALPLRMTKSMLAATTEKVKSGSDEYEVACALWSNIIPVVLPNLLQLIRHAQAFHNLANWSQLPDELQLVVKRTLQDRFWQSGISNESKDEFYARISGSKTSYEGFASVVRGTMRNIREQGYHLIYLMTKYEEQFYGLPDLPESLAHALFADAGALSTNHLHPIINLATGLVQRCPPHYRATFLPPLLTQLFTKLDAKISSEWEALGQASQRNAAEDEELGDEMRTESVLRHLTYSMVSFVPFLLEFDKLPEQMSNGYGQEAKPTIRDLVLEDLRVLEPMILFATHGLRMRDGRSCSYICRTFRTLVPLFLGEQAPKPQVREFISTEVLKAAITSLNEPYFADMQKGLASLIALILQEYSPRTSTPREVLLSLPNMQAAAVDKTLRKLCAQPTPGERMQRALVLQLLEGVRGVSIYEAGKIRPKKVEKVHRQYMEVEKAPPTQVVNGHEAGLEGVAGLFGVS